MNYKSSLQYILNDNETLSIEQYYTKNEAPSQNIKYHHIDIAKIHRMEEATQAQDHIYLKKICKALNEEMPSIHFIKKLASRTGNTERSIYKYFKRCHDEKRQDVAMQSEAVFNTLMIDIVHQPRKFNLALYHGSRN